MRKLRWRSEEEKRTHSVFRPAPSHFSYLFVSFFRQYRDENCVLFIFSRHKLWFLVRCIGTCLVRNSFGCLTKETGSIFRFNTMISSPTHSTNGKSPVSCRIAQHTHAAHTAWLRANEAMNSRSFYRNFPSAFGRCLIRSLQLSSMSKVKTRNKNSSNFPLRFEKFSATMMMKHPFRWCRPQGIVHAMWFQWRRKSKRISDKRIR